ncbi:MAG TPA: hypothetical protein GX528_03515 [Firmicutes bacterium]|nr:hypothetical protein [Bacillota bacterium]
MIVNSERTLALLCPACQEIQEHKFSIFAVSKHPFPLLCDCGFSQGHLRRLHKNFEFDVLSISGDRVRLLLNLREFLYVPLLAIFAPQSGQEIGFFGDKSAVKEVVRLRAAEHIPHDSGGVANPEIMREVLQTLQDLAESHKIRCECEHSSVGIDVYADRVELVCAFCGSTVLIGASMRKHQERLSRVTEIVMEPSTYTFLEEWLKPLN